MAVVVLSAVLPRAFVSADSRQLVVDTQVLDQTLGSSNFQKSIVTRPSATAKFKITITAEGQFVENAVVRAKLPEKLLFVPDTIIVGGVPNPYASNFFGSGINIGTVRLSDRIIITFLAQAARSAEFPIGETDLTVSAFAAGNGAGEASSSAKVTVSNPESSLALFSKKSLSVWNVTRNADGLSQTANPGDTLTYTLYFKNTGELTLVNVPLELDIRDVMQLARVVNLMDAKAVDGGVIKFENATVNPGAEISRKFQVRIKDPAEFPAEADGFLSASFGNETRVAVGQGQVSGIFIKPPRTGAGEWLAGIFAGLATLSYWIYRKLNVKAQMSNQTQNPNA